MPCGICCVLPMTPYVVVMDPESVPIHLLFIVINKKFSVSLKLNMNRLLDVYFQVFVWLFG